MQAWELDVNDIFKWFATPKIPGSAVHTYRVIETLPKLMVQEHFINGQWGHATPFNEYAEVELLSPLRSA